MATGRTMARVDAGVAEAQARGYNGTPSFEFVRTAGGETYPLVGAQPLAQFNAVLGPLAAGEVLPTPSPEPTPVPPELPFWAVPEGLAADPARPGFTMAGDPYRGDPASRFAVVEFSDFQCPACRTHAVDVEPELRKQLVEAGMVQWVYKDLPLAMHPQAALAAAAAQCAGEQGKFWEMHDRLFAEQERWAVDPPDPVLRQLAAGVGLDAGAFSACLDGRGALEAVLDDIYAAQSVPVTSTPTFIFFDRKNGVIIRGSRPAKDFVEVLQGLIRTADPTPASGG
jgi:protein-disulfide isomerase